PLPCVDDGSPRAEFTRCTRGTIGVERTPVSQVITAKRSERFTLGRPTFWWTQTSLVCSSGCWEVAACRKWAYRGTLDFRRATGSTATAAEPGEAAGTDRADERASLAAPSENLFTD